MFTTAILAAMYASAPLSQIETHEVIVHKEYKDQVADKHQIWKVFTDRKRVFEDGTRIQPVLSNNKAVHRSFCENYTRNDATHQFRTMWLRKRFTEPARLPIRSVGQSDTP